MHYASLIRRFVPSVFFALTILVTCAEARNGATDPIPGTSNGATNSNRASTGGGKSKSSTVVTPAPVPVTPPPAPQPLVTRTLQFTVSPVNGVNPVCTGSYHIDPYYPTLSLMTVDVEATSVSLADGQLLYVDVKGTGGTLYPFTSNLLVLSGGNGLCSHSVYVTPGTVITAVTLRTASGQVIATGL